MIKTLEYSVTFPSNGKTLSGTFTFESGTTAVIGPNWSGKTFGSIEVIRYALFGKKALRGPATDYKSLHVVMVCAIAGVDYRIERSSKQERLLCADEVLAVNTEAVNQKVVELLGFGLEIFDFVCAASQGQVQKFSELRPAQRKQMIDNLLRLQPQELVEKACKDEAKTHRATATALASSMRLPVEPTKPQDYHASEMLENRITAAKELKAQRTALTIEPRELPEAPTATRLTREAVAELQQIEDTRRELVRQREALEKQISGFTHEKLWTHEVLNTAEAYLDYEVELDRRGPRPSLTLDEIEEMEKAWAMQDFGETEVQCPNCRHEFAPGCVTVMPDLTVKELRRERTAVATWAEPLKEVKKPEIELSRKEILKGRATHAEAERIAKLQAELKALPLPGADHSRELHDARNNLARWEAYDNIAKSFQAHNDRVAEAVAKLALLPLETEDLEALQAQLVEARVYETELRNYETNLTAYNDLRTRKEEADQLALDFTEGAKAIATARLTVKSYLAPALSRVASSLIETMTAGELSSLTVDENMEVSVGTQDINTLSGAGKTIANLALRIAMGQVLTARVFPVFIGDEIDSDMDAGNAAATADALAALTDHLQQVILVTHKQVEHADHLIIHPVSG